MLIKNLFEKDIFRPINGVVKADQLDESAILQELDEFVVTRELDQHLRDFFSTYCEALDGGPEAADKIGVWVSGFFGSGKSHFIKILSYLLDNEEHIHEGQSKRAVDFFKSKIVDKMLFGEIKRAVASDTDVILFNIDSKADVGSGKEAILGVFLKVLNEMQGYSGDYAHIAHMERYLDGKGLLPRFRDTYRELTDTEWAEEREAYEFNRDQVVDALSRTLGQSRESCEKWIDGAEEKFVLNIENFAEWTKEYLDSRGPKHRLVFLVDEVGQFIGGDTNLMLNLQTITEELGTTCGGRAWVVVTSQEDIDAVLGEMKVSRANDFSKIQGRFDTRLSLSSANVDEVIQERLLAKNDDAKPQLAELFSDKGAILKNQLSFKNPGMTFKQYADAEDFVRNYPFAPYQFRLLQKIFESIRKAGATGLHLAQGERSLLDAFQSAGKAVGGDEIGVLVPLYLFYPSIESFLDTVVKQTIDYAREHQGLEPFDTHVLEVLFLIRYVDEIKGNVDNLVTLCLDEIDADRLALRRKIEESLQRLEKESLVNRNGDNYFFLTNEEREIDREIKSVELNSGEEAKLLGELVFSDVLKDQRKHRYGANKMDFAFNRVCDAHPTGNRMEGALVVSVITPLSDEYDLYGDEKCLLESTQDDGQIVIRLGDDETLSRDLRMLLKTEKYLRTKDDGTLSTTTKRIHRDLAEDNRDRRERLVNLLSELLPEARFFVAGQRFDVKASAPMAVLGEALEYLIKNTFTKMDLVEVLHDNPLKEIQAVLRSDDIAQHKLELSLAENNPGAIDDVRTYVELCGKTSRQVVLHEMINTRYANRPYGWPEMEVVLLLARLYVAGEIQFVSGGGSLPPDKVYEAITTQGQWRKITVLKRVTARPEELQKARQLGKEVFSEMGPDGEDALFEFLHGKARDWSDHLSQYRTLAETGKYPGKREIDQGLTLLRAILAADESNKFIERFNERKAELLDLSEDFHELEQFYEHQRSTWEKLRSADDRFGLNRLELERDEKAAPALGRMSEILSMPSPYGFVQETEQLVGAVAAVNDALLAQRRAAVIEKFDQHIAAVKADLKQAGADDSLRSACLGSLEGLRTRVGTLESLAHIDQAEAEALRRRDEAIAKIEAFLKEKSGGNEQVSEPPPVKRTRVIRAAEFVSKEYLEDEEEVDAFLAALRVELKKAVSASERVQVR